MANQAKTPFDVGKDTPDRSAATNQELSTPLHVFSPMPLPFFRPMANKPILTIDSPDVDSYTL
jgi:hypothetical protein